MEAISISEFLSITGISEQKLLLLLEQGLLTFNKGDNGELLIDISALSPSLLAQPNPENIICSNPEARQLIEEIIASEVANYIEGIWADSWELALSWTKQQTNGQE